MNKQEFLKELTNKLTNVPQNEKTRIVEYYNECIDDMIEDGMSETEAINNLGDIDEIIKNIEIELPKIKKSIKSSRVEKTYTFKNNYKTLNIIDINIPIHLYKSKDEDIHIKVFESDKDNYSIFENLKDENSLNICFDNKRGFFENILEIFDFGKNKFTTEVYLPKSNEIDINIKTENGGVQINDISANNVKVKNTNGQIKVSKVQSKENIKIVNKNGKLDISEIDCTDLLVENGNGKLEICDVRVNEMFVKNVNGKVEIKDVMSIALDVKTVNGALEFDYIDFIKSANLETTNGQIDLSLSGSERDYNYIIKAKNGAIKIDDVFVGNYLNGGSGDELLNIKSKNGAVYINFKNKKSR